LDPIVFPDLLPLTGLKMIRLEFNIYLFLFLSFFFPPRFMRIILKFKSELIDITIFLFPRLVVRVIASSETRMYSSFF